MLQSSKLSYVGSSPAERAKKLNYIILIGVFKNLLLNTQISKLNDLYSSWSLNNLKQILIINYVLGNGRINAYKYLCIKGLTSYEQNSRRSLKQLMFIVR